jgi:molecular chaperone DnaK
VPQIEVTFDIDANGIVNVSAKDMATSKEQSIRITASSGMSKEDIEQAVKDAELHAEEDRKKKELIEARNHADGLIYSTEKSMKDLGEKVDADTRAKVEEASTALRKAIEGEDVAEIKRLSEALTQTSHKLAEAIYQQAAQKEQAAGGGEAGAGQGATGKSASDDDVVDADFEEVKGDKK